MKLSDDELSALAGKMNELRQQTVWNLQKASIMSEKVQANTLSGIKISARFSSLKRPPPPPTRRKPRCSLRSNHSPPPTPHSPSSPSSLPKNPPRKPLHQIPPHNSRRGIRLVSDTREIERGPGDAFHTGLVFGRSVRQDADGLHRVVLVPGAVVVFAAVFGAGDFVCWAADDAGVSDDEGEEGEEGEEGGFEVHFCGEALDGGGQRRMKDEVWGSD